MNPLTLPHHCFTLDTDEDQAARLFVARYGQPPEHILEQAGLLWLGPIPGEEAEHGTANDGAVSELRGVVTRL